MVKENEDPVHNNLNQFINLSQVETLNIRTTLFAPLKSSLKKKKYKKTPMHQARFLFICFEQKEVEITVCSVQSDTNQLELSMAWR